MIFMLVAIFVAVIAPEINPGLLIMMFALGVAIYLVNKMFED